MAKGQHGGDRAGAGRKPALIGHQRLMLGSKCEALSELAARRRAFKKVSPKKRGYQSVPIKRPYRHRERILELVVKWAATKGLIVSAYRVKMAWRYYRRIQARLRAT